MTIRARLTLVYSSILGVTLVIFGLALYSIQARDTLDSLKQDLYQSSDKFIEAVLRTSFTPPPVDGQDPREPIPPKPFNEFSDEQAFEGVREREIVRVLDVEGNLVASPFGRDKDALPLSEEGLVALQDKGDWYERSIVSDEPMLIYSRPILHEGEVAFILQVARSLTERDRTLRSLATTLLIAGLITIGIAIAVGWVLSGLTLRPIDRITQTARAIGDERDFTRRVDYSGKQDEVGQLAATINQMLTQLQDAYQKVEKSLQQQRNFVSDVSHELRTPLTTLRGNLGLLKREPSAGEADDILTDMVDESDRMIRLVNNLLLMAHADAGRSLAKEPVQLLPLIEEVVRRVGSLEGERQINLDLEGDIAVLGDRDALEQVLLILLDNALKYSEKHVDLEARLAGKEVKIRVEDHGPGIPPEEMEHVFERFYRASENHTVPGFGLGLSIAKGLIEAMGGKITLTSEGKQGTKALVSLPAIEKQL